MHIVFQTFFTLTSLFFLVTIPIKAMASVPTQPSKAIFYANEVELTSSEQLSTTQLPSGEKGFTLTLPSQVIKSGLNVSISGIPTLQFYWKQRDDAFENRPEPIDQPLFNPNEEKNYDKLIEEIAKLTDPLALAKEPNLERKALLEQLMNDSENLAVKKGNLESTKARVTLWKHIPLQKNMSETESRATIDEQMEKMLPSLFVTMEKQTKEFYVALSAVKKTANKLAVFDKNNTFETVYVPYSSSSNSTFNVAYTYSLPASNNIHYRLKASPQSKKVTIDQVASLTQQSGFTWENVDVLISTANKDRVITPSFTPSWQLNLHENRPLIASRSKLAAAPADALMLEARVASPIQEEQSTFRNWNIGKQRIGNNIPIQIALTSDSYDANYYYTLRPTQSNKGFLTADITSNATVELPLGQATFFVDDVPVGEEYISLNGNKATLFFGTDPQINVSVRNLDKKTGEKGLISKEQTRLWNWELSVKNDRNRPVAVVIEEPAPETMNTAIKVSIDSTPRPEEVYNTPELGGTKVLQWKATIDSGKSYVINHKITASAPTDKIFDSDR